MADLDLRAPGRDRGGVVGGRAVPRRSRDAPRGATVLLVVRVGRAVLVDQIGFAYPAGLGPAQVAARLDREIEEQTHRVVSVVGAMCTLRERGC